MFIMLNKLAVRKTGIASVADSFIAASDEEYVLGNKIPLWLFGFLY